jgi:sporulation protein YunB
MSMSQRRFRSTPTAPNGVKGRPGVGAPWLLILAVLILLSATLYILNAQVRPVVAAGAKAVGLRAARTAMNRAIAEELTSDAAVRDIVHMDKVNRGDMKTAVFDFAAAAHVQASVTTLAERYLSELEHETLKLPLAQALGGALFSSVGPSIPVRVSMVGSAHASVHVETKTVGINQTVHVLMLDLEADVQVIAPTVVAPAAVQEKVPLAYVMYSGDVPNSYFANPSAGWLPYSSPAAPDEGR